MTELNDELLVAYVDGQLAKDQSKAVERVLEEDQVAAQRVDALRAANVHLEVQFEAMLAGEPVPGVDTDISATLAKKPLTMRGVLGRSVLFAWVGFGCLLGGSAAGYILHDQILPKQVKIVQLPAPPPLPAPEPVVITITPPPATWQDDAVRSYALLSRDTFKLGLDAQGNRDLVSFQIGKALRADFAIPDLSAANLTFERAQLLQRGGAPLAQITYLPQTGAPVVLFAMSGTSQALLLEEKEIEDVAVAGWGEANLSFLLAGDLPQAQLRALAETIQTQRAAAIPVVQDTGLPDAQPVTDSAQEPQSSSSAPASTPARPKN